MPSTSPPPPPDESPHSRQEKKKKKGFKFHAHDFVSHQQLLDEHHKTVLKSDAHRPVPHTQSRRGNAKAQALEEELDDQEFFDAHYEMLHFLGKRTSRAIDSGTDSQVFCCKHRATGELRAVKVWRKSRRTQRRSTAIMAKPLVDVDLEDIDLEELHLTDSKDGTIENKKGNTKKDTHDSDLAEFQRMKNLYYPNIAKIFELLEGPTHYYMVMEYGAGGTVQEDLKRQPGERYPEDKAALVIALLLQTLSYLHSSDAISSSVDDSSSSSSPGKRSVIHCDLNWSNVIMDSDKDKISALKLIGFGDAVLEEQDIGNSDIDFDDVDWFKPRGTQVPFMAPEMLAFDQVVCKASDMWSLGVMAYILLSGKYPFGHEGMTSTRKLQQMIQSKLGLRRETDDTDMLFRQNDLVWNDISDNAKDFLRSCLRYHPEDRPTAEEAWHHQWLEQARERAFHDRSAGLGLHQHAHQQEHAVHVWSNLKAKARQRVSAQPNVLKHAALTFIATQLVLSDEKKYIDEVFQLMDIKADGVLTKEEVRQGYQKIFGKELKESDLEALFNKVDLGGTGAMEYSEFVIAALNEKQLLHTTKLRQAFDAFDTDGTGFISAANLRPLLRSYLAEHDEEEHVAILEQIIASVDSDGDGEISFEEFTAMMLHSSNGKKTNARRRQQKAQRPGASVTTSLTTSMLMVEPPNVFASTTSSLSSGKRKSLWESSVQIAFRPENMIGKRSGDLLSRYDLGDYIQSGAFGSVWFCYHKVSGAERAVKYVKKSEHERENQMILREFNILRSLDHPNVLKMFEMFEDHKQYEIVMDACRGGDLCDEIDNFGAIAEQGVCLILRQVLVVVNYCHQRHIVHCDLKPDNILMEESKAINQIKVIDFGLAANMLGEEELKEGSVVDGRIKERRGTLRFMAPEVLKCDYGPKCDVWACGVMAFLLLADRFPFDGEDKMEIATKVASGIYYFGDPIWGSISKQAKSFISQCLTVQEDMRPTAEEALQHPWFQTARDVVTENFYRKEVCTAAEALKNIKDFENHGVLSQAVSTFIASQLVLKEEKARIDEVFRVMDVSCDGKLSKQEVKAGYLKVFGVDLTDKELDEIFDKVDMDGTGYLEYGEFVAGAICQEDLFKKSNLKKAFEVFDTNNRGYISKGSLKRGLTKFLGEDEVKDDIIQKIMLEVDRDGDGRISYEEFLATMLNLADVPVTKPAKQGGLLDGFKHMFDKKE